jgi:hypothetical protein
MNVYKAFAETVKVMSVMKQDGEVMHLRTLHSAVGK